MNNKKPYLVDAVIGNSRMLATLGRTGKMYRLWWPNIDTPQHVDAMRVGIQVDGSNVNWFDEEGNGWNHDINYANRSNVLHINASNESQALTVNSRHFAVPSTDLLVREYAFVNSSNESKQFSFVVHSSFVISENGLYNTTMFNNLADSLIHFRHQYFFGVSSAIVCTKYQAGISWEDAQSGQFNGGNIDMRPDGALSYELTVEAGETVIVPIYVAAGNNEQQVIELLEQARKKTSAQWADETNAYWNQYLNNAVPCPVEDEEIKDLYERSILMFKLMSDEKTGTIIAAPEFDETYSRCGGYSYCWGRDAAFITTALDKVGLKDLTNAFYDWTLSAQSPDGSWQQRHYHDGQLAPSWGLQIDEGASIIWGMWQHYLVNEDRDFAARVWPAVSKGAQFLESFIDPATGLPKPSIDLWEEREASHTYSSAAVYGGLTAAAGFAELAGETALRDQWNTIATGIQAGIETYCFNNELRSFYRGIDLKVSAHKFNTDTANGSEGYVVDLDKGYQKHVMKYDPIVDISLLGISVPFNAVAAESNRMRSTADAIEKLLTVEGVGGIKRYEDDNYIGGNPWILTTLWLAHYRFANGEVSSARQLMQWTLDHRTETGLLPEQVDKNTGETAWVVPLTWSHAMFILAVFMLAESK
ncbi:MAG: glycoside hydrolase family 15 protein [Candidatus Pristimantibacillus lignocellulolyticus]|uniref:Glycoside hydrolase family 15 protein n=1 Tax=Candidatus Pristimantibacillus lignocellulolyticus TaxID=2994561 RepID=A0A9J6ZHK2_9BACL|nr:MAG: glycoside hydrolase family 15 protein [Candidatus Pristimantibacillus lignocellulolyticus]